MISSPAQVTAEPFINGLPVFTYDFFAFNNGILQTTFLYQGKPQNNDSAKVTPLNGNYPTIYVEDDNGLAWGEPEIVI